MLFCSFLQIEKKETPTLGYCIYVQVHSTISLYKQIVNKSICP